MKKKKSLKELAQHHFLKELALYIWIPAIIGLVLYIFWELQDFLLGSIILVALSATYIIVRLYLLHKKWWLLATLPVIIAGALVYFFASTPSVALSINSQAVTGSGVSLTEGSVSVSPAPEPNGRYAKDTVVTLTASSASGYDWQSWSGTNNDSSNPTTVTMNSNKQVTVNFESRCSLTINNQLIIGSLVNFTEGSVSVSPAPGADGKYAKDTVVTLTASSASGYDWQSWSGTSNDLSNPTTVTIVGDKHVTVNFDPRFLLIINNHLVTGSPLSLTEGSVLVSPPPGADGRYAKDTVITLTAVPGPGYYFHHWEGNISDDIYTIIMDENKIIRAYFTTVPTP